MADPFLSEIRLFSFNFPPKGWAACNGQLLPINQNQALFSLLGTIYGGNGYTNFALPDLRSRIPMHFGNGHVLGEMAGEATHTLILSELPTHNHLIQASAGSPNSNTVSANIWTAKTGLAPYQTVSNTVLHPNAISTVGGSQAHENRSPYLVLNFCIALQGIYPSRD